MYCVRYLIDDHEIEEYVNELSTLSDKVLTYVSEEFTPNDRWKDFTTKELKLLLKTGSLTTQEDVEGRWRLNAEIVYELNCRKYDEK